MRDGVYGVRRWPLARVCSEPAAQASPRAGERLPERPLRANSVDSDFVRIVFEAPEGGPGSLAKAGDREHGGPARRVGATVG